MSTRWHDISRLVGNGPTRYLNSIQRTAFSRDSVPRGTCRGRIGHRTAPTGRIANGEITAIYGDGRQVLNGEPAAAGAGRQATKAVPGALCCVRRAVRRSACRVRRASCFVRRAGSTCDVHRSSGSLVRRSFFPISHLFDSEHSDRNRTPIYLACGGPIQEMWCPRV